MPKEELKEDQEINQEEKEISLQIKDKQAFLEKIYASSVSDTANALIKINNYISKGLDTNKKDHLITVFFEIVKLFKDNKTNELISYLMHNISKYNGFFNPDKIFAYLCKNLQGALLQGTCSLDLAFYSAFLNSKSCASIREKSFISEQAKLVFLESSREKSFVSVQSSLSRTDYSPKSSVRLVSQRESTTTIVRKMPSLMTVSAPIQSSVPVSLSGPQYRNYRQAQYPVSPSAPSDTATPVSDIDELPSVPQKTLHTSHESNADQDKSRKMKLNYA